MERICWFQQNEGGGFKPEWLFFSIRGQQAQKPCSCSETYYQRKRGLTDRPFWQSLSDLLCFELCLVGVVNNVASAFNSTGK